MWAAVNAVVVHLPEATKKSPSKSESKPLKWMRNQFNRAVVPSCHTSQTLVTLLGDITIHCHPAVSVQCASGSESHRTYQLR